MMSFVVTCLFAMMVSTAAGKQLIVQHQESFFTTAFTAALTH